MAGFRAALLGPLRLNMKLSPVDLLRHLNDFIYDSAPRNRFITFFYAKLDLITHHLVYINAGHNPPLLISRYAQSRRLDSSGLALGIQKQANFTLREIELEPEQFLFLYTDGITEAMDLAENDYGESRLLEFVERSPARSMHELVNSLIHNVEAFRGHAAQRDDITALVIQRR